MSCITLWWTSAIVVVLLMKRTVRPGAYPFAFAFTSLTQPCTGAVALLCARLARHRQAGPPLPACSRLEVAKLCAIGLIMGVETALTNKALQFLTVAARTMINSTNVLFMMATAWLCGLERFGWLRAASALTLILGGLVQGMQPSDAAGGGSLQFAGVIMQAASILCSSVRWALVQFVLQRSAPESALGQMSKLDILARVLPVTGVSCVFLACCFEPGAYSLDKMVAAEIFLPLLGIACALAAMLSMELALVKSLSAVAFLVLSTVHQIPIVLAGVEFRHEHVGMWSGGGFGICIVGALLYAAARGKEARQSQRTEVDNAGAPLDGVMLTVEHRRGMEIS